jgi:hypothetical protein
MLGRCRVAESGPNPTGNESTPDDKQTAAVGDKTGRTDLERHDFTRDFTMAVGPRHQQCCRVRGKPLPLMLKPIVFGANAALMPSKSLVAVGDRCKHHSSAACVI